MAPPTISSSGTESISSAAPSTFRAWWNLVLLSMRRQARAHWMLWVALGLLGLTLFIVYLNTRSGRWSMAHWRYPFRVGPSYAEFLATLRTTSDTLPWDPSASAIWQAATGVIGVVLAKSSGFFVFSNWVVFSIFTTFLLPLWSLSFATEALGREREAGNLIWVLTRPIPRSAIYLAKFAAVLPWTLVLNMGGFALICLAGGDPGRLALQVYWPAVLAATLAFCSLFQLMGAIFRRPAVIAVLYTFFFETISGNLPGHTKRFSISFYTRCLMFDRAHDWGIRPERPSIYLPVDATTAVWALAGICIVCLVLGMWFFARSEYLQTA